MEATYPIEINDIAGADNYNVPVSQRRDIPRPCYYILRVLGVWQPHDANYVTKFYTNYFILAIWFFCLFASAGDVFFL